MPVTIAFSNEDPPTSYSSDGILAKGLMPELAALVFNKIEEYALISKPYPWARAKLLAEKGGVDGLLTYPSESRKKFILFSDQPTYISDYSYIIFSKNHPKVEQLREINHHEELYGLRLVTEGPQTKDSWEEKNIPLDKVERIYKHNITQMFHQVFLRNVGDFFIRNPEEAKYIAAKLGYADKLEFKKVSFPSENNIPFHLGIVKSHPHAKLIVDAINQVQDSEGFRRTAEKIVSQYQ